MRIKTVINHNQNDGLLKMIKRTDPIIFPHATSALSLLETMISIGATGPKIVHSGIQGHTFKEKNSLNV